MLTVMCPNCRHRFPAPGCCNPGPQSTASNGGVVMQQPGCLSSGGGGAFYGGGYLLVPREYNGTVGGCFINAPTIIHGPTIIQQPGINHLVDKLAGSQSLFANDRSSWKTPETLERRTSCEAGINGSGTIGGDSLKNARVNERTGSYRAGVDCHINTTCDLTGGTVTITTPGIQSGGCLIQSTDTGILVQAPRIEIRPKLTGGGCYLEKRLSTEDDGTVEIVYRDAGRVDGGMCGRIFDESANDSARICLVPPSGCQELPGIRRCENATKINEAASMGKHGDGSDRGTPREMIGEREESWQHPVHRNNYLDQQHQQHQQHHQHQQQSIFCNSVTGSEVEKRHSSCCCGSSTRDDSAWRSANPSVNHPSSPTAPTTEGIAKSVENSSSSSSGSETVGGMEIRVNATVQLPANVEHCTVNITATTGKNSESGRVAGAANVGRARNNFNGGGLVQMDGSLGSLGNDSGSERREDAPTTPVSWLIPCPWQFDNYSQDKEVTRLADIKRLLHTSGWYHEGLSWQQSETLLKNAPLGSWLMRDSSDSRFIFAVSVQTARGPTSVRVHYFLGRFRLDAEPQLSHNMPSFECPIKMLEHYVDYSNRIDEHRKEVWVDYSGQLYSQIYLTKPLVKEVRSLSHLARLVVNGKKIATDHLPPLMKNYLAEYPYSL